MFGDLIRSERLKANLSLRDFCRKLGTDASNWSKIERGIISPPQNEEVLAKIANILGIKLGTEKWQELLDKAHIDAGIIPPDLLSDKEVLSALPMFYRTLRNEKPSPEKFDELIAEVRKGI